MKLFRIFAVGLILAAVVVSTALAPVGSAASIGTIGTYGSFSDFLFTSPALDFSSATLASPTYTTPSLSATGPTSNPPEADVVPNFSGLVVEGPVAVDPDDDGDNDFLIDEDGEIFINNRFEVNGDPDEDNNAELNLIGKDSLILGKYVTGVGVLIDNILTRQVFIDGYDDTLGVGFITLDSPNILMTHFTGGDTDVQIDGDLKVTGKLRSSTSIGSYYIVTNNASAYSTSASCDSGDYLTGCSGYASTSAFKGAIPNGLTCTAYRSSSGSITAYAICLDPVGIRTT